MTVDHLIAARILDERDHHDRRLLTLLRERGQKPALSLRPPKPQVLVPHVELVKLQIHRHVPPANSSLRVPGPHGEGLSPATSHTMPTRDTLSQKTAPSIRFQWSYERKPARDRGGLLSHLVPAFLDFGQAGLEESAASLRVTRARSCPTFPGLLAAGQQLPSASLRVTPPPTPPPRPPRRPPGEARPGAAARGTPAAADALPLESLAGPSRDGDARCAGIAQRGTPPSSSAGSLQLADAAGTTSGRTGISSVRTSSPFASQSVVDAKRSAGGPSMARQAKRRGWVYFGEQKGVNCRERLRMKT